MVVVFLKREYSTMQKTRHIVADVDKPVAHNEGSGVNSQYYFILYHCQGLKYNVISAELAAVHVIFQQASGISIVIPFRNEARVLPRLAESLGKLKFGKSDQLLFINDHSEDSGPDFLRAAGFTVLEAGEEGKKSALLTGIKSATNHLILTLDADCVVPPDLLTEYRNYLTEDTRMIAGPVIARGGKGLGGWLHRNESFVLMVLAYLTIKSGVPILCNGASLLFSKDAFFEVGGYDAHIKRSSGDDILLMHSFYERWKGGIKFLDSWKGLVVTEACTGLGQWLDQRLRWLSKPRLVRDIKSGVLALFLLLLLVLPWLLCSVFWATGVLWTFFEYFILWKYARQFGLSFYIGDWFFFRFMYPLAVIILIISRPFRRVRWKERPIK